MVLPTGITPDSDLQETLNSTSAVTSSVRFIRCDINSNFTQFTLGSTHPSSGETDNKEFDNNISAVLNVGRPQYIYYKKDDRRWLLINYIPEGKCSVKEKMIFASSLAAMKDAFDPSRVSHEITINERDELNWEYIHRMFIDHTDKMALLSDGEKLKLQAIADEEDARTSQIKAKENNPLMKSTRGLMFPFNAEAEQALANFNSAKVNFCQFKVDTKKEKINLAQSSSSLNADDMSKVIPATGATFNLYKFVDDAGAAHNILALCMPMGIQLPIKEKMLNASCKNGITDALSGFGIQIDQNLEIESGDELNQENLSNRCKPMEESTGFVKKAQRPGGKPRARPPRAQKEAF